MEYRGSLQNHTYAHQTNTTRKSGDINKKFIFLYDVEPLQQFKEPGSLCPSDKSLDGATSEYNKDWPFRQIASFRNSGKGQPDESRCFW